MGGGGYGDPIDREPEAVLQDAQKELVSEKCAREIYGVILDLKKHKVDIKATAKQRLAIRSERIDLKVDSKYLQRAKIPSSGKPISEYLQQTDVGATQCTWCGEEVAPKDADWKDHAILKRVPVSKAGPYRTGDGKFFLIEAYCSACGTLLDTDLAMGDDPPLYDRIKRWP